MTHMSRESANHNGDCVIVSVTGDTKTVKLSYTSVKPTWLQDRSVVAMTSSAQHIFIADSTNNIHAHSWTSGKAVKVFSASTLKLQGLNAAEIDAIIGLGYSDEHDEPMLRVLVGCNSIYAANTGNSPCMLRYVIYKVEA